MDTRNVRWLTLLTLIAVSSSTTFALGPYLEVTGFPSYKQTNTGALGDMGGATDGSALNSESGFSFELRNTLGVQILPWLMIGGRLNYAESSSKRGATATVASLDRILVTKEWGTAIGFYVGNLRLTGAYIISGSKRRTERAVQSDATVVADNTINNKRASGFEVMLGYNFPITNYLRIGPTLVYRRVTYKAQSLSNAVDPASNYDSTLTTSSVDGALLPMVSITMSFF